MCKVYSQILHIVSRTYKQNPLILRYIINGIFATLVHFSILTFNFNVLNIKSAGLANLFASVAGIVTSFFGSRYFVFEMTEESMVHQAGKFILLYAVIACFHGLILYIWTDNWHLDYRFGFLIATLAQFLLSYLGNTALVFKK